MKYIFIGGGKRGYDLLLSAIAEKIFPEYAIICKEDDHETYKYSEKISVLLKENKINYTVKKKITESDHNILKEYNSDLIFMFGWRTIIDTMITSYSKYGILAAHYSLLPAYRGFAPLQWSIINGEKKTGVTFFFIDAGEVDSGKILLQKKIRIRDKDYIEDLDSRLTEITIKSFLGIIKKKSVSVNSLKKQNENNASYTCKRKPDDGRINWNSNSENVYNFIRALSNPDTYAFCKYKDEIFQIKKSYFGKSNRKNFKGGIPGRVINISAEGIEVLCREGSLRISEWINKKTGVTEIPSLNVNSVSETLL